MSNQGKGSATSTSSSSSSSAPAPAPTPVVAAYTTMLPNIAPAPGPAQGQQQMAAQAAPMAGQPITAQMGPALQQQQFFVNPQAMPAGAAAAAPIPMTQFATYNQQGQLVIQQMPLQIPANQQPGQQQILYTNAAAVAAQQQAQQQQPKPGQPMMAAGPPGGAVAGKPMAAMPGTAVSQNYAIAGSGTLVASTAGGQQTLMIANPMSTVTSQPGTPVSVGGSQQVKQIQPSTPDGKGAPANMASAAATPTQMIQVPNGALGTPQTPQMFVNAQGAMVMASMPGQAFVQGNQIFLRAPAPQDANAAQPVMFSSPTAPNQSPLAPQQPGQMQPQANPQLAAQPMQPMAMARAPMSTFQPVNQPVKPGKTAISRAMPIRPGLTTPTMPGHLQPQPQQLPHTSPKGSKSKSPRVPGLIGRPPGPGKAAANAALNALKSPAVVAPQRLPTSVVSSMAVVAGPPMLQTTQALLPPPVVVQAPQTQFPGMPKLQPMAMAAPPAVGPPASATVEPKKEEAPGSAASATDSKDEVESKENLDTPKAVVKPNVLSHVIDGHVIKESSTPFPVRDDKEGPLARIRRKNDGSTASSSSTTTTTTTTTASNGGTQQEPERRGPGRPKGSTNNKPSDKGKNRGEVPSKRAKLDTDSNGDLVKAPNQSPAAPAAAASSSAAAAPAKTPASTSSIPGVPDAANILKDNPLKWSVQRVCDFVKKQPGCAEYVPDFELQEIDGQALMLLKVDHLRAAMSMKLGPALKVCEAIESMREALNQH